ncbi:MAG: hypothetical protein ACFFEF_18855 [Candidatus Thorarchaeota archaeon]
MKRARRQKTPHISAIVPKNHFTSMSFFRESPLINWRYTSTILFTAFDVFRSSDWWLDSVINSGLTLKEALVELGFPKENTMIADTGIFELEAKKAGLARELGIDIQIELSNSQIFEAYDLSGADFFVAPDEIVFPTDGSVVARSKLNIIEENLLELLEHVKASDVIAVLQGIKEDNLNRLFDFYRSQGVSKFAAGGIIPLYRYNKALFRRVISYSRTLTKGYWLHTFGLPDVGLLPFYLQTAKMDSVDTSMLLYLTAKRRFLSGVDPKPVRLALFEECECPGCRTLNPNMYTQSDEFFIGLYIHNISEAAKVADSCRQGTWKRERSDNRIAVERSSDHSIRKGDFENRSEEQEAKWMTAYEFLNGN